MRKSLDLISQGSMFAFEAEYLSSKREMSRMLLAF